MALTIQDARDLLEILGPDNGRLVFNQLLRPDEESYYLKDRLPDGRVVAVVPLIFGRARMGIGSDLTFDDIW